MLASGKKDDLRKEKCEWRMKEEVRVRTTVREEVTTAGGGGGGGRERLRSGTGGMLRYVEVC